MPISRLDTRTAKLITSSVVISSVYSVVKELLENAIDAGATSITISLEKYGLNRIEVRDNGSGICHEDVPLACLAGYTSKIQDFSDLENLHSYGFRGQALNALCAVADLSFTTRTSDDDVATTYTVDKEGRIISSGVSYLGIGTTVVVKNLFNNLPVRRKMLTKSASSLRTILWLLRCFSMAKTNLALSLVHDGTLAWKKCTVQTLSSAVHEALGYKLAVMLHQMYWKGSYHNSNLTTEEDVPKNVEIEIDFLLPKKGQSISEFYSTQTVEGIVLNEYLIINGRPIKNKKIEKMVTSCIGKGLGTDFPNRKKPPWVLRLNIPSHQLDVNLESDKTKVFVQCEEVILQTIEERIVTYYGIQVPNADLPSQSLGKKSPKNKLKVQQQADDPQASILSNSPLEIGTSSRAINPSNSESDGKLLSHPPPPKQARLEVEELQTRSPFHDLNLDDLDPNKNCQPFLSLEPFEISDSQVSEIGPHEDLPVVKNVLDVSSLKLHKEEFGLGSFRIEVFTKPEQNSEEKANLENGRSSVNKKTGFNSTKSPMEEKEVIQGKGISAKSQVDSVDKEDIMEAVNIFKNIEMEDDLDLEAWSKGKISANGVPVGESVEILQSNCVPSSENISTSKLITNKQICVEPFKMLSKVTMDGHSSKNRASSRSNERIPQTNFQKSPLPNACSQLGRQDMRGFNCFASKARPKILAEQPGILFTDVASELAKRWEALSDEERDEYKKEGIAKAATHHKTTNPELTLESFLPKKTTQKLPGILNDKSKQETLLKKIEKEKQKMPCDSSGERTMNVSINEIMHKFKKREESTSGLQREKLANGRVFLIGQLKPSGMWVYKQEENIGILRHFALQELVVYHKLMDSLSIPILPLTVPILFDERVIGSELWRTFLSLESHHDLMKQQTIVTSELIVKNGFEISLLPGNGESEPSALITGISSVFTPYGIDDLKEILEIIDSADGKLSKSRTLQITCYIESEAVRICRQSSPVMSRHDVQALLMQWNGTPKCLHSQPVLVPFDY